MRYEQWDLDGLFEPLPGFSGEVKVGDMGIDHELDV
jgi:hypothetical protein